MTWLTREEAAAYLKVSVRQFHRLELPRSLLGKSWRYNQEALDQWLKDREVIANKEKGAPARAPRRRYGRHVTDVKAAIKRWR